MKRERATTKKTKKKVEDEDIDSESENSDNEPSNKKAKTESTPAVDVKPTSINVHLDRVRCLSDLNKKQERHKKLRDGAPVIYWMSRDQRVQDNWALLYGQQLAKENKGSFAVVFNMTAEFPGATERAYTHLVKGLKLVEKSLQELQIPFFVTIGDPAKNIPSFVSEHKVGAVVADFNPMRPVSEWKYDVAKSVGSTVPFFEVDTHNIVPVWTASQKQEVGARTLRPKIHKLISTFLGEFPDVAAGKSFEAWPSKHNSVNWDKIQEYLDKHVDHNVKEVTWAESGEAGGRAMLQKFLDRGIKKFSEDRNDPNLAGISGLSPWIHFGQLASQRIILEARKLHSRARPGYEAFFEELVVRKELSDNFCFYNKYYDSVKGFADWAQASLKVHEKDKRDHLYTYEELEAGKTYDDLWNACQLQMVGAGKMHGYMRMYWAKKILEWTHNAEEALAFTLRLNDKWSLDGRDPNGYVGCAWSIGGVHDRGWTERPVFGKIRYMNYAGCQRKFNVKSYVDRWVPHSSKKATSTSSTTTSTSGKRAVSPSRNTKMTRMNLKGKEDKTDQQDATKGEDEGAPDADEEREGKHDGEKSSEKKDTNDKKIKRATKKRDDEESDEKKSEKRGKRNTSKKSEKMSDD